MKSKDNESGSLNISETVRPMVVLSLTLAGLLAGCTGSVHPLLTEENLLEDSDLSGEWILELRDKDDKVQKIPIELDGYDTSTYALLFPERQGANKRSGPEFPDAWTFQIGKIDDQLYGQLIPQDLPHGLPVAFGIPIYWFGKVSLEKDVVKFFPLLDTKSATVAEREHLQHMTYEPEEFVEMTVFTMPTADLQKTVTRHEKELFSPKPMVLRRVEAQSRN